MARMPFSRFGGFWALPQAVQAFAWSAPLRELAARIGVSDVALRKQFHKLGIVTPPQGYWNRAAAGRPLPAPPTPPPRRPGERGRIRLDPRFCGHVTEAPPLAPEGPFASSAVPEELEALRAQELRALGRVRAPRDLARPAPGLARLLRREDELRRKALAERWAWQKPHFDGPLAQRQLRLLSGLFLALAKRGHEGEAWESEGELSAGCTIGDTHLRLEFAVIGTPRGAVIAGRRRSAPDLPAASLLRLSLGRAAHSGLTAAWQDDETGRLEVKLGEIAAGIIAAGEAAFRQSLLEEAEAEQRQRERREQERQQRRAAQEEQRLADLRASGELLRQAGDIRALVERVEAAIADGASDVTAEELARWREWALGYADRIDPVSSGQVLAHIRPAGEAPQGD